MKTNSKKTVLIGANTNPEKYAYKAANSLIRHGHQVVLFGLRPGEVGGNPIHTVHLDLEDVDTVTLYVNPTNQLGWYDQIIKWQPKRIIFNPGTENETLIQLANQNGIEAVQGCTLVMLSIGTY